MSDANGRDANGPLAAYAAARAAAGAGTPVVALHIGTGNTQLAAGDGAQPSLVLTLDLGAHSAGNRLFRHDPPTPGEVEEAIMVVEDEVMPLAAKLPPGATLATTDAAIRQVAHVAGVADAPRMVLALDDVERVYGMLAAVALGRPALNSGVPTDALFAMTLLVLREFMQHLGFSDITITA